MYKAKLLGNTVAQPAPNQANGILKNATTAIPLKYLSNFWRPLEIPSINCKVELKFRWTKHVNVDSSNIIFTIKDTKLYVPVATLLAKYNQKLSKLLSKAFERLVY